MARVDFKTEKFEADISKFLDNILPDKVAEFKIAIAGQILTRVVEKSPVDTGRFRGNWQVSVRRPIRKAIATKDKVGGATISKGLAKMNKGTVAGHSIWITNNLPYAVPLEHGHSGQAPAGVVAVTLAEVGLTGIRSIRT